MSLDLSVKITRNITIGEMIEECQELLPEIIPVHFPKLEYEVIKHSSVIKTPQTCIIDPTIFININFSGGSGVNICVVEIPVVSGYEDADEEGVWACPSASHSPDAIILTAVIALSLANLSQAKIIDEAGFWIKSKQANYSEFLVSLKGIRSNTEYNFYRYCKEFCEKLPQGK